MLKEQQPQTYCHVKHTTQTPEIKKNLNFILLINHVSI